MCVMCNNNIININILIILMCINIIMYVIIIY